MLPAAIAFGSLIVVVMPAVEFDDQSLGRAEEVYDIGADRRLPSKVRAVYREFLQCAP